jgi:hypothetical protein
MSIKIRLCYRQAVRIAKVKFDKEDFVYCSKYRSLLFNDEHILQSYKCNHVAT